MRARRIDIGRGDDVLLRFPAVGDSARSFGRTALALSGRLGNRFRVVGVDPPGYADGSPASFGELYAWAPNEIDRLARPCRVVMCSLFTPRSCNRYLCVAHSPEPKTASASGIPIIHPISR